MNSEDFVKKLASLVHTPEYFIEKGCEQSEVQEMLEEEKNCFLVQPKQSEVMETNDELESLVCKYDTSNIEIGMLTLGKKKLPFQIDSSKLMVGLIEADPIVINKLSGEIELIDHAKPDFVIAKCATSGERFLEAILLVASFEPPYLDFFGDLHEDKQKANNEAALALAKKCAEVAGISNGVNIYETLLGCL